MAKHGNNRNTKDLEMASALIALRHLRQLLKLKSINFTTCVWSPEQDNWLIYLNDVVFVIPVTINQPLLLRNNRIFSFDS